jgi:glycosyltransferase involved in cell wall biosynthesis
LTNPTVSVCVPTYNGSAFLEETMASISAQTFEDFEVLFVDDASTDDTVAMAKRFAAADRRVRVVRNTERAGASARNANRSIEHARGEWIKFLFQDDLMAPTCLARMLDAGRRGKFVIAWHDYVFSEGVEPAVRQWYESLPTLATELPGDHAAPREFCEAVLRLWRINFIGPTSTGFVHRDCVERYGKFRNDLVSFPDLEYWMRLGSVEGLTIAPEPLVTFRVHNRSISGLLRSDAKAAYANRLDGLLANLCLARSPEYAALRVVAREMEPPFDVEAAARNAAFEADWLAIDARYHKRDSGPLAAWADFCQRHPLALEMLRESNARQSLWYRAKQAVKARL